MAHYEMSVSVQLRPIRYWLETLAYKYVGISAELKTLRNSLSGSPLLIVGNGPSLNETPLDEFCGLPAIGMNKIDLLFPQVQWRPSLILAMNRHVLEQHQDNLANMEIPVYLSWQSRWFVRPENRSKVNYFLNWSGNDFSTDISAGIGIAGTVTYTALQFAYYMNADPVILFGIDHHFRNTGPANKLVRSGETDPDHFDPNYFAKGVKWNLPDMAESEVGYRKAKQAFESVGRQIYDATVGGKLTIFPKISIEQSLRYCRSDI